MKKILQRGKHLWKAKGRHGTHSPFVYAFVEQVMRNKMQFRVDTASKTILTQKQINLTGRTLRYLKPDIVYTDAVLLDGIDVFRSADGFPEFKKITEGFSDGKPACFICLPTKENIAFLEKTAAERNCSAIIPLNYKDKTTIQQWDLLRNSSIFAMVLDAWYVGLVSNHPDFKTKQYFRLR